MTRNQSIVTSTITLALLTQQVTSYAFLGSPLAIHHTTPCNSISTLTMKVSKGKSKHGKSNTIHTKNQERKRLAGRPGTKMYMDPNKIFIGNLPYKATQEDVKDFLKVTLGNLHNVESVKIISDWKTGISKGYGFVQFMDPIYATSAMEIIKGKKLMGRVVRFDQGKEKEDDEKRVLFIKKRERKSLRDSVDTEESVIDGALDEVEAMDEADAGATVNDFDADDDDLLFGDGDDEDDELDGWYEQQYGNKKWEELSEEEAKNLNREQRREAQRLKPKKKKPAKGFGNYVAKTPAPKV
eukprot:scaffold4777_cov256-Chaetoceros_neogracile.AAC.3